MYVFDIFMAACEEFYVLPDRYRVGVAEESIFPIQLQATSIFMFTVMQHVPSVA